MTAPLAGLRVVEFAPGISRVGAGLAASLPGSILRDLGASVTRLNSAESTLDIGVEFGRVWDRGKEIVADDPAELARDADVLVLAGPEELVERRGLSYRELSRVNPGLVVVRIRPSHNALGPMPDLELLVAARAGLLTQIRSHRPGPAFADLAVASAGAGLSATAGALARLYERAGTGRGGWVETSLYEGLSAILPMIIGRVAHDSPSTTLLWRNQGPAEALAYRCADGEYVQLWFGAKGAYEDFLAQMGDPPSERGYTADLISGAMVERGTRWAATFATRDREHWMAELAGHKFRCEPVLRPGEALRDGSIGLAVEDADRTVLGPVLRVSSGRGEPVAGAGELLSRVRVLDLSAYLAGPVTPLVLAELGAEVLKVEPPAGDAHRNMHPMFAAGQRGKRAVSLDLKSPAAAAELARLLRWSDVVHHNSRVGLAEKLGYAEADVRAANPDAIYSFASGFGESGPRALLPANDQLMQALSGVEAAQGGIGQPPTYLVWGAIDVTGGWLAACGILAALYARRTTGGGQSVSSSLLGAALTLKSGAFLRGDQAVSGPILDAGQTGYGATYRLYQTADDHWLALAIPDPETWHRLRATLQLDELPTTPPPLRTTSAGPQPEEILLEQAFRTKDATAWVDELRAAGIPVEPVPEADRTGFIAGMLDDPVNQGRIVSYDWGDLGRVEQLRFPPETGPAPRPPAPAGIPELETR